MSVKQNKDIILLEKQSEPRKLLKNLFEQKTDGILCDVQLHFQGSSIWAHACVLASCSSYFMEYFQQTHCDKSSWESHWCLRKPLIINLDCLMNDVEDFCLICVTKIIDFMYLRELVVLKGHFHHFSKIVNFLKVFDLIPLCETSFIERNLSESPKNCNSVLLKGSPSKVNTSQIFPTRQVNSLRNNQSENKRENQPFSGSEGEIKTLPVFSDSTFTRSDCKTKDTNSSYKSTNCTRTKDYKNSSIVTGRNNSKKPQLSESINSEKNSFKSETDLIIPICRHNEATVKGKCEFLCCNPGSNIQKTVKGQRTVRKLMCEICSFSTVSLQKMLKHIESSNHCGTVCSICRWHGESMYEIKEHLKDHVHSKPYMCHICKKRNRHWEYHKLHLKVHCKNKQFHCKVCQKSFKRRYNLTEHLVSHKKHYVCNKCDFVTNDLNSFKSHPSQHTVESVAGENIENKTNSNNKSVIDTEMKKHEAEKQFHCQLCKERFTQRKNLTRHIQLKHCSVVEYSCSLCNYKSKRTDLLRHHIKKHHNCVPDEAEEKKWKQLSKQFKKQHRIEEDQTSSSNVVGVLIPVQLVSADNSTTLSAFAVKACSNDRVGHEDNTQITGADTNQSQDNEPVININSQTNYLQTLHSEGCDQISLYKSNSNGEFISSRCPSGNVTDVSQSGNKIYSETTNNTLSPATDKAIVSVKPDRELISCEGKINSLCVDLPRDINYFNSPSYTRPTYTPSQEFENLHLVVGKGNMRRHDHLENDSSEFKKNEDIWLNEATGELLDVNNIVNVHVIDSGVDQNPVPGKTSIGFNDSFQTLLLNEATGGLPVFDVDDKDELPSNPQTPQTNVVEFDDPDNLFSWNCIDNSFCSTWVLNEATGELNMVSFSIEPLNNSDELKLDENSGVYSSIDDDETALFLNEGTGDLSVIYFNPNKTECCSPKHMLNEPLNQETLETLSEHSNDDDDLLNEEFLMASASFMAQDENKTFLNELTGEFDIANLNNYQHDIQENQATGSESIYLNEETGEISWNVLAQSVKSDLFTNADILSYDLDDSINCEDFEHFSAEINDFSSHFCLDNNSNDWHTVDETCDTLLNECTGELVRKT